MYEGSECSVGISGQHVSLDTYRRRVSKRCKENEKENEKAGLQIIIYDMYSTAFVEVYSS